MPDRLVHDEAFALARKLVGCVRHLLREEEIAAAFNEFYDMVVEAICHYAEVEERQRIRLRPEV